MELAATRHSFFYKTFKIVRELSLSDGLVLMTVYKLHKLTSRVLRVIDHEFRRRRCGSTDCFDIVITKYSLTITRQKHEKWTSICFFLINQRMNYKSMYLSLIINNDDKPMRVRECLRLL